MDITDILYGYHWHRRHVWISQTSCKNITDIMQEYLRQHAWISQTSCMDITDIMYGYHRRHVWILQTSCMDITNIMYGYLRQHTRISQTSRHVWILQTSCMDISDIMQEYHRHHARISHTSCLNIKTYGYHRTKHHEPHGLWNVVGSSNRFAGVIGSSWRSLHLSCCLGIFSELILFSYIILNT